MASGEDMEREERLKKLQMMDLGTARREFLFTVCEKSEFDGVKKHELEAVRASNVQGTEAHRLAEANRDRLSAWANAAATVEQEETEDIQTFNDGQSHRARLNRRMEQDNGPDPWEGGGHMGRGGRGGRASGRGRGGGLIGSTGRGGYGPTASSAGPSSSTAQHRYQLRSAHSSVPTTAPAPTRGGSAGPMRATIRPLPKLNLGNHPGSRPISASQAPQPSASFQSRTTSNPTSRPKGKGVMPSSAFESQLYKALNITADTAKGTAKLGVTPSGAKATNTRGPARVNHQQPIDPHTQVQIPRAPAGGQQYDYPMASPEHFMAVAMRLIGPNPAKIGPVIASAPSTVQVASSLRPTAAQASSSAAISGATSSNQSSGRPIEGAQPSLRPSRSSNPVINQLSHSIHANPRLAEVVKVQEAALRSSFIRANSQVDLQESHPIPIPQIRLPGASPQPVVTFSPRRSQTSVLSQDSGSEIPQIPSSARQSFPELQALSERESNEEDNRIDFDEEHNLINFDDEVEPSPVHSQYVAAWTQPDQGILDLANEQITSEPLQPRSAAGTTNVHVQTINQETVNLLDSSIDVSKDNDLSTLSFLLSQMIADGERDPQRLKLQTTVQNVLNRLARGKKSGHDQSSSRQSLKLDVPPSSEDLRAPRQGPSLVSPVPYFPSYEENAYFALDTAVSEDLRGATSVLEDGTNVQSPADEAPAAAFSFALAPESTRAVNAADSLVHGPDPSVTHGAAQSRTQDCHRSTVEPDLEDVDRCGVDEYVKLQQATRASVQRQEKPSSRPVLQPRAPSFQPSVSSSGSIPDPLPLGRSLFFKARFPFLSEEERSRMLQAGAIQATTQDDGPTDSRFSQDGKAEELKCSQGRVARKLKASIVFASGLKLHDVPLLGEHLLPGRSGALAPGRPTSTSGQGMPPSITATSMKSGFKSDLPTVHSSSVSASKFGDRLLPGRLTATSKVVVDPLDIPMSNAPIFGNSILPGQRPQAQQPANISGHSNLVGGQLAGPSLHKMEVHPKGKAKTKQPYVREEVDPLVMDEPPIINSSTQAEKVKYSAEKLLGMQKMATLREYDTSTFKNNPMQAAKDVVSNYMINTHGPKPKHQARAQAQQPLSQVREAPQVHEIFPKLPVVPPKLPEGSPDVDLPSVRRQQSSSSSAFVPLSQTSTSEGAAGRSAIFDSIYAAPEKDVENRGRPGNPASRQSPPPRPAPQTTNIGRQTTENAGFGASRFSTSNAVPVAAPPRNAFALVSEKYFADSAQRRTSTSAQNPFAPSSRPSGPSSQSSTSQAQSAGSDAVFPLAANSGVYRREDSGYEADKEIHDSQRKADKGSKATKPKQDLHSSRWAADDTEPPYGMLRTRRTFQNDGLFGRR